VSQPGNVLLTYNGYIRLCNFGCSVRLLPCVRTFTVAGSPEYMAPEMILGMGHDHAVDLWSLGVLAFALYCNYTPFIPTKTQNRSRMQLFEVSSCVQCHATTLLHPRTPPSNLRLRT